MYEYIFLFDYLFINFIYILWNKLSLFQKNACWILSLGLWEFASFSSMVSIIRWVWIDSWYVASFTKSINFCYIVFINCNDANRCCYKNKIKRWIAFDITLSFLFDIKCNYFFSIYFLIIRFKIFHDFFEAIQSRFYIFNNIICQFLGYYIFYFYIIIENKKAERYLKMRCIPLWWTSRSLFRTFLKNYSVEFFDL